ncbi:sensor histidine kinase [Saccharobesus litoralis]|uniref:sensor histidine kinase n=1 Tax=Saccharobesus litoralis TaxID=2172099 RepID=UPI001E2F5452|nr:HAMP domain-containing sensor histidine kinase [Saccharobesus litoralis]
MLIWGQRQSFELWSGIIVYAAVLAIFSLGRRFYQVTSTDLDSIKSASQIFNAVLPYWVDLTFYAYLLFFHGGASSGAVSVLFIPVISAATQTHWRAAWLVCLAAVAIYTFLMWQGVAEHFHHYSDNFTQHLAGMWLTFVVSALLMTWFLTNQKRMLLKQNKTINQLKERQLRDEQILAVATSAANAAHTLATPLSTANLLVGELKEDIKHNMLDDLQQQLDVCSNAVRQIAQSAKQAKPEQLSLATASSYVEKALEYWWVSCNEIRYHINMDNLLTTSDQPVYIKVDLNLQSSFYNLFENAARASLANQHDLIEINVYQENDWLVVNIDDYGLGIPEELTQKLGQQVVPSEQGMGIGLALANATIERLGGELQLINRPDGTRSQVRLPIIAQAVV